MLNPGGRPSGPEPHLAKSENLRKSHGGKEEWNQRLAKVPLGADSKNLKMRRLPPMRSLQEFIRHGSCRTLKRFLITNHYLVRVSYFSIRQEALSSIMKVLLVVLVLFLGCGEHKRSPQSPTPRAPAQTKPSDTACNADCNNPSRNTNQEEIWCGSTSACGACPVPATAPAGSKCTCQLWSRAIPPKPIPDNFDPDWKKEAQQGAKIKEDTNRRYSCQCGY